MERENIIFVTGIAGFIGYHIAKKLNNEGYKVIGLDNLNSYYDQQLKIDRLKDLGIPFEYSSERFENDSSDIVFYLGDIQNYDLLLHIYKTEQFTSIIHLAAQAGVRYSLENPNAYIDSNIKGFMNILELSRYNKMNHVVYASSSSVYGVNAKQPFSEDDPCNNPVSLYAATKKANENMAEVYNNLYNINLTGLRFFTVYGPWGRPDMAPMLFTKASFDGGTVEVFNYGNQSRDFTFIGDIVEGIFRVFKVGLKKDEHLVFNIGNGKPVNLLEFITIIEKHSSKSINKKMVKAQPGDVVETYADIKKLSNFIEFTPSTTLNDGIEIFIEWYKKYYKN